MYVRRLCYRKRVVVRRFLRVQGGLQVLLHLFGGLLRGRFRSKCFYEGLLSEGHVITPISLVRGFVSFVRRLLRFEQYILSISLLFDLVFFFFLFLLLGYLLHLHVLRVDLVANSRANFLFVGVSLARPSIVGRLFGVFFGRFRQLVCYY